MEGLEMRPGKLAVSLKETWLGSLVGGLSLAEKQMLSNINLRLWKASSEVLCFPGYYSGQEGWVEKLKLWHCLDK